jgi:type IV pilus assembly protein PilN
MRITVNLATRPFIELRPFLLRLRIVMAVLVVVAVGAIIGAHLLQKKLDVAKAQIDQVHAKVVKAQQEKQGNERRMSEPANAAVLARAHFLNTLFLTKSFSWTAVMMDLETVLPSGVQVTSIEPQIASDGDVIIRLRVSGDRDRAVQLVRNLERSRRFLAPRLTGEAVQAKEAATQGTNVAAANSVAPPGVEFEILANYNPLPEGQTYATVKPAKAEKTSKTPGISDTAKSRSKTAKPQSKKAGSKGYGIVLKPYSAARPKPANGGAR